MVPPGLAAAMVKMVAWEVEMPQHGLSATYFRILQTLVSKLTK